MADVEQVVEDWLNGEFGSAALPRLISVTNQQGERIRRAAEKAAVQAYRRIMASRQLRLRMLFGTVEGDMTKRVLQAWIDGQISGLVAAELIGESVYRIVDLAREHGLTR